MRKYLLLPSRFFSNHNTPLQYSFLNLRASLTLQSIKNAKTWVEGEYARLSIMRVPFVKRRNDTFFANDLAHLRPS